MIKLDKKKLIIIISIFLFILLSVLLIILLKKDNKKEVNNKIEEEVIGLKYKEGYALDTKEAIEESIYQIQEESGITYNLYGEIGWANFSCMKETDKSKIRATQKCNDQSGKYDVCSSKEVIVSGYLSDEAYVIENHYIVSLDSGYDSKGIYHMDGAVDDFGTFWLNAYADLPDGTLIGISSYGSPYFQINIYDKETRVIISDDFGGIMYFRVPDLNGRVLNVQVGNKIFKTSGNSEFLVYSKSSYYNNEEQKTAVKEFLNSLGASKYINNINEIYYDIGLKIGGFIPVSGNVSILTRGTTEETELTKEYRFAYYRKDYKYVYNININSNDIRPEYYTYQYLSVGKEFDTSDNLLISKEYYGMLKDQKNLDKTNYGFGKVISKTNNSISSIMKKYVPDFLEYSLNVIRDYNSNKASKSVCGSDFLDALDNCGCKDGWYHIKGVGCCPNGYTYSTTSKKCIKTIITTTRSCPDGTYYVGNDKCCRNGTTLSNDGLSCVSSSGSSSTPSYYPDSNGGATEETTGNVSTGSSDSGCKPTTICDAKDERGCAFYGMYEKNGECCMDLVCVD